MLRFSTLTLEIDAHPKAPDGYYYAATRSTSRIRSDHPQALRRPRAGDANDDGARHDVRAVPVGCKRRQLSHDPTLLQYDDPLGDDPMAFL